MNGRETTPSDSGEANEALQAFQTEMREFKEREARRELPTAHLADVNPSLLTAEDMAVWRKVQDESLIPEELAHYAAAFVDTQGRQREDIDQSRHNFLAFINNKATPIFVKRQRNAMDKPEP